MQYKVLRFDYVKLKNLQCQFLIAALGVCVSECVLIACAV